MIPTKKVQTEEFKLNPAQLEAVTAPLGPVLILAGAGSGKTRALTLRIVYLIKKLGIEPQNILAVTFTNKAAGEMKERIFKLMGSRRQGTEISQAMPVMGTFHSIGARILRAESSYFGMRPDFVIFDDNDQESLLKDVLIDQKIDPTKLKPSLFARIIDRAKNNLEEPDDIFAEGENTSDGEDKKFAKVARAVYADYQKRLQEHNAMDFGDLIMLPVMLFKKHPQVLKKYQELWQYLLIDEYQDTNHAQYIFSKMLTAARKNIFVVGDDAQAIYGFRGANLQNILDFEKDYPQTLIIRLEQNYRSTTPILSVAEKVIQQSPRQHRKKLWTENTKGHLPILYRAADEMAEAWYVASKIIKHQDGDCQELEYVLEEDTSILGRLMRKNTHRAFVKLKNRVGLNNIAVLYRTHAQSRPLEEVMIESGIPYQIVGGLKFYERREIKDLVSFLRLLLNPNDLVSLKRVINVPPRGIGPKSFETLKQALLEKQEDSLNELFLVKPAVKGFFEILNTLNNLDKDAKLLNVVVQMVKLFNYENYLRDGSEEGEGRFENVQELFNVAAMFNNFPWKEGLVKFLEEVALMTSADELDLNSPKVTLMTLHQAKGLEFKIVFLVGLEEGLLPHARSIMNSKDIAEEIRLAYVGVTRAREYLYLVHAYSRKTFGMRNLTTPSRILRGIPEELLEIQE